eukprot:gnl/TRDRNA2_/TRDRNA2_150780_c0_seq1.p2 gnl/TRDRNA2_/TRDRNA2_150780_c0~~gnl/TRDRNA2_/TRDRNA2_150780_c0_seq1.p2  ORF type:complete len:119 (+),score=13.29 gnl/TRDRNA2_/TRDRNA2_150780_c0_seq1:293-649(+)
MLGTCSNMSKAALALLVQLVMVHCSSWWTSMITGGNHPPVSSPRVATSVEICSLLMPTDRLMEHEQQGCLNAGVELLNQIQDAAGSTCGFVAATKLVMAMHLADATRVDVSHCSRRKV